VETCLFRAKTNGSGHRLTGKPLYIQAAEASEADRAPAPCPFAPPRRSRQEARPNGSIGPFLLREAACSAWSRTVVPTSAAGRGRIFRRNSHTGSVAWLGLRFAWPARLGVTGPDKRTPQ